MTAEHIASALGGRRAGSQWCAPCPAHDDRSPSLSLRDEGGRVLVHCFCGCRQAEVIDALRSRGLWPERERPEWTPQQRADWARQQRDLVPARYWRRAMTLLLEDAMDAEKAKLVCPAEELPDCALIYDYTRLLQRLNRAEGEALVREYREWCAELPEQCAALVRWAQDRERVEVRALATYLEASE